MAKLQSMAFASSLLVAMGTSPLAHSHPCPPTKPVEANHAWMKGTYKVVPVLPKRQKDAMQRIHSGNMEEVDASTAKRMAQSALSQAAHYYVIRVGYVGGGALGSIPPGVSVNADVDVDGAAFVTSAVLSNSQHTSEFAAILDSSTALKKLVPSCMAAR
jgi:hypothetical protein